MFRFVLPTCIQLALFLCANITALGQTNYLYIPVKDDSIKLAGLRKTVSQQYIKDSSSVSGENKKYIVNIYRERYKGIDELFADKELISSAEIDAYLNAMTNEIINKNPELKKLSPHFFFSRANWPNAYSTGEGTIVFNIDLFAKLKNESQVVFVLCHELAHFYIDHGNKQIEKYINTIYSDEFQKKLKALKKTEYNKNKELEKLELSFASKHFRHSREFESEADSMGLVFMQNTGYDCRETLSCLALLDEIDEESINIASQLPKLFSFDGYPFKSRWTAKEESFFGSANVKNEKREMEDSLKTHPDCKTRIKALTPLVEKLPATGKKFIQPEQIFTDMQTLFQFEIINYCFAQKKISKCFFNTIKLQDKFPANVYLATITGDCLNEMYSMQKDHRLYSIVELPSPFKEEQYNTLLEFIGRLSLGDINAISYNYLKQYTAKFAGDARFEKAFEKSRQYFTAAEN